MASNLPQRPGPPAARQDPRARGARVSYVYAIHGERRLGGFGALLLGVLLFAAIVAFLILGAITLTIALWLACGLLLASVIGAVLRRVLGIGRGSAPGPDPR